MRDEPVPGARRVADAAAIANIGYSRAMGFRALLLLAVGLAMDATAVAAARGCAVRQIRPTHVARVALFFGGFQALMPLIGWVVGAQLGPMVEAFDHYIAFGLLGGVGAKMLWEARGQSEPEGDGDRDLFGLHSMLVLAIATSIDAFAVGVTLPLLDAPLVLSLVTIGITTALLSVLGLYLGRHFGSLLGKRLDAFGGIVLIGLGTKILVDHLRGG